MATKKVPLRQSRDILAARQACREIARQLGFGSADQTRLATAVSEITRNAIQHAGQGLCIITDQSGPTENRISVVVEDNGPGIADLDKALSPGFSTNGGLGAGMPAAKRLVHVFRAESRPGHTKITLEMIRKKDRC